MPFEMFDELLLGELSQRPVRCETCKRLDDLNRPLLKNMLRVSKGFPNEVAFKTGAMERRPLSAVMLTCNILVEIEE